MGAKGKSRGDRERGLSKRDATEILKQIRQHCRRSMGALLREWDRLWQGEDTPPSVRLKAMETLVQYATGGPPHHGIGGGDVGAGLDTEEYRAFLQAQQEAMDRWKVTGQVPLDEGPIAIEPQRVTGSDTVPQ